MTEPIKSGSWEDHSVKIIENGLQRNRMVGGIIGGKNSKRNLTALHGVSNKN